MQDDQRYTICLQDYHFKNAERIFGLPDRRAGCAAQHTVVTTSGRDVLEEYLSHSQNLTAPSRGPPGIHGEWCCTHSAGAIDRLPPRCPGRDSGLGNRAAVLQHHAHAGRAIHHLREDAAPAGVQQEKGWRALKVEGPFDFSAGGCAGIPRPAIGGSRGQHSCAIATYDTDYLLVKESQLSPRQPVRSIGKGRWAMLTLSRRPQRIGEAAGLGCLLAWSKDARFGVYSAGMGKRRCRECGAKYEDGFQHCPVCGAEGGRRIARCKACGSRLTGMQKGRCPVCGKKLRDWGWVRPLLKIAAVVLFVLLLAATYVYSYIPQLGMPTPVWPTSTKTVTLTATRSRSSSHTIGHANARAANAGTRTPTWTPIPPTATRLPQRTYVVQYGDSLWGIADMFEISIEALMIANNLTDRDLIHEDDIMVIPTGTPTPPVIPTATPRPAAPVTRLPIATSTPKP